jgi:hypothetical protein
MIIIIERRYLYYQMWMLTLLGARGGGQSPLRSSSVK